MLIWRFVFNYSSLAAKYQPEWVKHTMSFSWIAMLVANMITQPLDNIRRLQMVYAMDPDLAGQSSTMLAIAKKVWTARGLWGFFVGADACVS
jgi:branched-subunit amino acid transport protein